MCERKIDMLQMREYGDGKTTGDSDEEMAMLLDDTIPWSQKRLWQAKSNGCFEPDLFLERVATKHPEITDPEEIARLAFIEYSKQNFVFGLMKKWAKDKGEKKQALYIDMSKTPYPRPADLQFESQHVPESFAQEGGVATGMARDPAFYISEKVASLLDEKNLVKGKINPYAHALDVLERQVKICNSMEQLHRNFFKAMEQRETPK